MGLRFPIHQFADDVAGDASRRQRFETEARAAPTVSDWRRMMPAPMLAGAGDYSPLSRCSGITAM
jgi:hypothetical protein